MVTLAFSRFRWQGELAKGYGHCRRTTPCSSGRSHPQSSHRVIQRLPGKSIWITKSVYDEMSDKVKFSNSINMWEEKSWTSMNKMSIYCSTYMLEIS